MFIRYSAWFPYDKSETLYYALSMVLWSVVAIIPAFMACSLCDSFLFAFFVQIIGQFKILRYNLLNIRKLSEIEIMKIYSKKLLLKNRLMSSHNRNERSFLPNKSNTAVSRADDATQRPTVHSKWVHIANTSTVEIIRTSDQRRTLVQLNSSETEIKDSLPNKVVDDEHLSTCKIDIEHVPYERNAAISRTNPNSPIPSKLLHHNVQGVKAAATTKEVQQNICLEMDRRLKLCIKHHQEIIM